jgi:hypothetical protein
MTDEELAQIADWLANGGNCPLSPSERASLANIVAELREARAAGWVRKPVEGDRPATHEAAP